jgi:competence protein ComEC
MHLLAVSGLHVLLVGMVLYTLLRPILHRLRFRWQTVEVLRAASTIAVLLLYMLLTGSPPSVVRAVVMAVLLIGSILLQRTTHTLNTLGVAAIVLLMLRPTALFDAGFQLSMSAVAGIVVLNPRLEDACRHILPEPVHQNAAGEWLMSMTTVSIAATLGTAPVLLHHFGFVALGGLILNIVAIPLTAIGLSSGLLMLFAAPMFASGASAFGASADASIRGLTEIAAFGATWMGGGAHLANPSAWTLASICAAVVAVAQFPRPKHRWRLIVAACLFATLGFIHNLAEGESTPMLEVLFLDVGQGDAVLVSTPDGHHMLVDAGPSSPFSDAGESVVAPHLKHAGIDKIDVVVATHPDSDHLGGVPSVVEAVEVDRFIHSGRSSDSELFSRSRRILQEHGVMSSAVTAGDSISLGEHVAVDVLGPPDVSVSGSWEENDASVVLMVSFGETRILLPGDVEHAGERWLVERFGNRLASDLVKAAHHGSSTSSTPAFVEASTSDSSRHPVAVIPVGRFNQFGMPVPDVLTRWQSRADSVFRTDTQGAVRVSSDGKRVLVTAFTSPADAGASTPFF